MLWKEVDQIQDVFNLILDKKVCKWIYLIIDVILQYVQLLRNFYISLLVAMWWYVLDKV